MIHVRISCHADLQALQARSDGLMFLKLVSLESLSIASHSYALLLRNLIERRYWQCPQIHLLSLVAGVAVELDKIKHGLFPLVEAKLGDDGFPEALLLLKNSALVLQRLAEDAQEIVKKCVKVQVVVGALLEKVQVVGSVLAFNVDEVLNGTRKFAWFHSRVPPVLNEIDLVLSTPVYFPDSE
ncbi:uncharacterized protein LOC124693572 [Lolium rigidum]|uniref:uncharacterized protein LOC124693572 n=1 Tax=Lolium rigidum TaxID=89674 RepID=UPI001F5D7EB3|nr:uncharacterized protein LOC124693572 [Lolium rigidum]